ncbi:hypothetical protein SLEP1_g50161 [Rubroshorea leprosula]|uniref:Uncharacterized protein n=1 Tax=Rubroshorea leprosula TaxID=152421 RepID=A0AAV5M0F8_9ROSI|nr:hypothetical protein SLEP1_g50161 [Rubroshorea leprosula]
MTRQVLIDAEEFLCLGDIAQQISNPNIVQPSRSAQDQGSILVFGPLSHLLL